jgi:hypothetical protein
MINKELSNNYKDYITAILKGSTGLIPFAGSIVSEIIGNVIPNQRIDRIAKFCEEMESRLVEIPIDQINKLLQNPYAIDLIEEGFLHANRAITDERRQYILNAVLNGISKEDEELIKSKYLLSILQQINDIEILWLQYYYLRYSSKLKNFMEKHKNIFEKKYTYTHSSDKELIEEALQKRYIDHLSELHLIEYEFDFKYEGKSNIKTPVFEKGKQKIRHIEITILGGQLLTNIGLTNTPRVSYDGIPSFNQMFKKPKDEDTSK